MRTRIVLFIVAALTIVGCAKLESKRTRKHPPFPPLPPGLKVATATRNNPSALTVKPAYVPTDFALTSIRRQGGNIVLTWINGTPPFQAQVKTNVLGSWVNYGPTTSLRQSTNPIPQSPFAMFRMQGTGGSTPGQFQWVTYLTGPLSQDSANPRAIKADNSGNLFMVGAFTGTVNFGGINKSTTAAASAFVAKYSAAGALQWVNTYGANAATANSIAIDSGGNLLVVGSFSGSIDFGQGALMSAGSDDIWVAKFTSAGAIVWAQRFGGTGSDAGFQVGTDAAGNVILSGWYGFGFLPGRSVDFGGGPLNSVGNYDIFIVKLTGSGSHVWSKSWGGTQVDEAKGLAVDGNGDVLYTGHFNLSANYGDTLNSAGEQDVVLAKYSGASGERLWTHSFGGTQLDAVAGVAVDGNNNPVIAGGFNGTINLGGGPFVAQGNLDFYLARFSQLGTHLWSTNFIAGSTGRDGIKALAIDNQNNLIITGGMVSAMLLGGEFLINPAGAGTEDVFVAKYGTIGSHLWSKRYGGYFDDRGLTVTTDTGRNVILGGTFQGSMQFGGPTQTNTGGNDGFVVQFSP